jgi:hypothetical protein
MLLQSPQLGMELGKFMGRGQPIFFFRFFINFLLKKKYFGFFYELKTTPNHNYRSLQLKNIEVYN